MAQGWVGQGMADDRRFVSLALYFVVSLGSWTELPFTDLPSCCVADLDLAAWNR